MRHGRYRGWTLLLLGALLLMTAHAEVSATSVGRDRSFYLGTVDPVTGELIAVPSNFINVGTPDRSPFLGTVNGTTGELTAAPGAFTDVGTPDRSPFLGTVNGTTGELTAVPVTFTNVGTPDRSTYLGTVNGTTGELTAVPATFTNVGTPELTPFVNLFVVNPATGELQGVPTLISIVFAAVKGAPALDLWGALLLAGLVLLGARWMTRRGRRDEAV